jgi:NAD(P)-dependent dehydrogenase (short-subunit alcohol dehydrogenase family)
MTLRGKRAIVTGAAAGIGRAIAERLAGSGAVVTLVDLKGPEVEGAAAALRARGAQARGLALDLGALEAVEPAILGAARAMGGLEILVNNAGIALQKPILEHEPADFERIFRVNLFGLFAALRAGAAWMVEHRTAGRIVNVASVAGLRGSTGRAAYGSSKAAVINLTQVAAQELAPHGITVNAIAPGPIETDMVRAVHTERTRAGWLREVPMGRYGEPADIAEAAAYLVSDSAGYVTGHVLAVDGGFAAAGLLVPQADLR